MNGKKDETMVDKMDIGANMLRVWLNRELDPTGDNPLNSETWQSFMDMLTRNQNIVKDRSWW